MRAFTQEPSEMKQLLEFLEEDIGNVQRIIDFVEENDLNVEFEVHAKAETVEESAEHSDIDKSRIVKSLVFIADEPILVLCSGDKRVDVGELEKIRDSDVRMADPEEVKDYTGYVVGGVSPFDTDLPTYMEKSIMEHDVVRPAAGSRIIGLRIEPNELKEVVGADIRELAE